jgi:hypothetical protein
MTSFFPVSFRLPSTQHVSSHVAEQAIVASIPRTHQLEREDLVQGLIRTTVISLRSMHRDKQSQERVRPQSFIFAIHLLVCVCVCVCVSPLLYSSSGSQLFTFTVINVATVP